MAIECELPVTYTGCVFYKEHSTPSIKGLLIKEMHWQDIYPSIIKIN